MKKIISSLVVLFFTMQAACADFAGASEAGEETSQKDSPLVVAEKALQSRDFLLAYSVYSHALEHSERWSVPNYGEVRPLLAAERPNAHVGRALTRLILLPYTKSFNDLLVYLGAHKPLSAETDLLYREGGVLDLMLQGVAFSDSQSLAGIHSVLSDEFPFDKKKTKTREAFFASLNKPTSSMKPLFIHLANELTPIEEELTQAAADTSSFDEFLFPSLAGEGKRGEWFHLTKSSITFINAVTSAGKVGLYLGAALVGDWSLNDIFGTQLTAKLQDPVHPEHHPGWSKDEYIIDFLSKHIYIADPEAQNYLTLAKESLIATIDKLRLLVQYISTENHDDLIEATPELLADASRFDKKAASFLKGMPGKFDAQVPDSATGGTREVMVFPSQLFTLLFYQKSKTDAWLSHYEIGASFYPTPEDCLIDGFVTTETVCWVFDTPHSVNVFNYLIVETPPRSPQLPVIKEALGWNDFFHFVKRASSGIRGELKKLAP